MRQVISLIIGLVVFATCAIAVTALDRAEPFGYWVGLATLGLSGLAAGYVAGYNARDAFPGILGGLIAAASLWFADSGSAWATTVLKAPLTSLNSDEVLLGLSLLLFAFLQGGRWGERLGLSHYRRTLYATSGVQVSDGTPPGGTFGIPAPPETLAPPPVEPDDSFTNSD